METTRPQSRKSLWVSGGWYLLAALPVGLGILTGVLSILAAMMLFADAPEWMLRLMAGIALVFSGYGMGRWSGCILPAVRCGCCVSAAAVSGVGFPASMHPIGNRLDSRKVLLQDVNFFPILHGTLENPVIL